MKYYSEKLNKLFESVEALTKAEKDEENRLALEKIKQADREKRAKEVNDAYDNYVKLLKAFLGDYGDPELDQLVNYLFSMMREFKL